MKIFVGLASIYSSDGTKDQCGDLGCKTTEEFVTEFSAAEFKLQPGGTSEVL
ncbi:MAG: peptidylprolyl isomerase [Bacteroidetes bacterium]|nr:peptidylprolyl isomerase [Bacteroidota bacterium]